MQSSCRAWREQRRIRSVDLAGSRPWILQHLPVVSYSVHPSSPCRNCITSVCVRQLCANSWGTGWGEHGYFRIARGVNESGIESLIVGVWMRINDASRHRNAVFHVRRLHRRRRRHPAAAAAAGGGPPHHWLTRLSITPVTLTMSLTGGTGRELKLREKYSHEQLTHRQCSVVFCRA